MKKSCDSKKTAKRVMVFAVFTLSFAFISGLFFLNPRKDQVKWKSGILPRMTLESRDVFRRALTKPIDLKGAEGVLGILPSGVYESLSSDCQKEWRSIASIDFDTFYSELQDKRFSMECAYFEENHDWKEFMSFLFGECNSLIRDKKQIESCYFLAKYYRSRIVDELFRKEDLNISTLSDLVLLHKLFIRFLEVKNLSGELKKRNLLQIRTICNEMIFRYLQNDIAIKARLVSYLVDDQLDVVLLRKYLNDLKLNTKDDYLSYKLEAAVLVRENNQEGLLPLTMEYIEKFPQDPMGYYNLAYYQWKSGHRDLAFSALKSAALLDPNNEEIKNAIEKLPTTDLGDNSIFLIPIELNLDI